MELDVLTYNRLFRDAVIMRYMETEEGRNYLKDCWRLQQTEPDLTAIKRFNSQLGGA